MPASMISLNQLKVYTRAIITERESDNRILECAISGNADLIVSDDKHMLKLKSYKNIPIATPGYLTYLVK
jgi:predicted nucleic acid-binding protein